MFSFRSLRALPLYAFTNFACLLGLSAQAQLIPDQTLSTESSIVTPNVIVKGELADLIEGGATRGPNLFHSFLEFNIDASESVYFSSPAGIESIIGRVTGGNLSTIEGLLGTTGDSQAALILINPNGVSFSDSASLDVQGAFSATTAESVELGDVGLFSATDPSSDNLLSVKPSAFFFSNLTNRGDITVVGSSINLQVPVGASLALLGSDILVNGSSLAALGGQINLGAVKSGTVRVGESSLIFLENAERGSIDLENNALISVQSSATASQPAEENFASIQINADKVRLVDGVEVSTGSFEAANAGNIALIADDEVLLDGSSFSSFTDESAQGRSGNIRLIAGSLSMLNSSDVSSRIFGAGDAGSVVIQTQDSFSLNNSSAVVLVGAGAEGTGNDVQIQVGDSLLVTNDSEISSSTFGRGDAGNVVIQAENGLLLDGSQALSLVGETTEGQGGNIQIETRTLSAINGSSLNTSVFGKGTAGDILVRVEDDALLDSSDWLSTLEQGAEGEGGDIQIATNTLTAVNGSGFSSSTFGRGNAGNILLQAEEAVSLDNSFVFSTVEEMAEGEGGMVEVETGSLFLNNGSGLESSTFGIGQAGNVIVRAEEATSLNNSFASSVVGASAVGRGGDVRISSGSLSLANGASLNSSTSGIGDAGSVIVSVRDNVLFNSSAAFSVVEGENAIGQGGDLRIAADAVTLANNSSLSSSTLSRGDAGNVVIQAERGVLIDNGGLFSTVENLAEGEGGEIQLTAGALTLRNRSFLSSNTLGRGDAGNVSVIADGDVLLVGDRTQDTSTEFVSAILSNVRESATGTGGNIQVSAENLRLGAGTALFTGSDGEGDAGDIGVFVRDRLEAENGTIATDSRFNAGGQIRARASNIVLRGDSDIQTFVSIGDREGGNIDIEADTIVALEDSDILAFSQDGKGGDIDLSQTALFSNPINPISENLNQSELSSLDKNNRVDINATGATASGQISTNDNVLIDNDLVVLPDTFTSTDAIVASSCIVRSNSDTGAFVLSGRDRITQSPTDPLLNTYSTNTIQSIISQPTALQEPQALYQLADGRRVMSHRCE